MEAYNPSSELPVLLKRYGDLFHPNIIGAFNGGSGIDFIDRPYVEQLLFLARKYEHMQGEAAMKIFIEDKNALVQSILDKPRLSHEAIAQLAGTRLLTEAVAERIYEQINLKYLVLASQEDIAEALPGALGNPIDPQQLPALNAGTNYLIQNLPSRIHPQLNADLYHAQRYTYPGLLTFIQYRLFGVQSQSVSA